MSVTNSFRRSLGITKVHCILLTVDPDKQEAWNQKNWEDLVLKMLSKSLEVVDHEEWIAELGEAFGAQIPAYTKYPEEKVGQL